MIKITKIDPRLLDRKIYNGQPNVRRKREVKGGFDCIVYATDQD